MCPATRSAPAPSTERARLTRAREAPLGRLEQPDDRAAGTRGGDHGRWRTRRARVRHAPPRARRRGSVGTLAATTGTATGGTPSAHASYSVTPAGDDRHVALASSRRRPRSGPIHCARVERGRRPRRTRPTTPAPDDRHGARGRTRTIGRQAPGRGRHRAAAASATSDGRRVPDRGRGVEAARSRVDRTA